MLRGVGAIVSGLILIAGCAATAPARAQEVIETREDFEARASAERDAYARQWRAERDAAAPAEPVGEAALKRPSVEANAVSSVEAAPSNVVSDAEGLACLNDNRRSVQLAPVTMNEFREGRAAGMITTPTDLCDGPRLASQALADDAQSVIGEGGEGRVASSSAVSVDTGSDTSIANALFIAALIALGVLYVVPTVVAFRRGHQYRWIIAAMNVTTGWTGIAWVAVFAWAAWPRNRALAEPLYGDATGIRHDR